ncbi:DUF4296 domain-containing protein [Polaribacter pectinis]|uniref:DUF4296 domain-containing protein n=1 Tax=Polaribacter pectinis TaxID=2738844 RepID=A0A7G9L855_9FLAO|nr:DUF4296 domain-containing protein [Polaribacter pectinis]QNM84804.1 DUF4296 domain-containing protein [Polaribacter pectinis]
MKNLHYIFVFIFLLSCTSNTIFEKPKDLIPKDTMSLIIQELMIASSAKFIKNKSLEKNVNYMPFVYDNFKIDSLRFDASNTYYISKVDAYEDILTDAKNNLEKRKEQVTKLKGTQDSLRRDSIKKAKSPLKKLDKEVDSLSN